MSKLSHQIENFCRFSLMNGERNVLSKTAEGQIIILIIYNYELLYTHLVTQQEKGRELIIKE